MKHKLELSLALQIYELLIQLTIQQIGFFPLVIQN